METTLAPALAALSVTALPLAALVRTDTILLDRLGPRAFGVWRAPATRWMQRFRQLGSTGVARRLPGRRRLSDRLVLAGWDVGIEEVLGVKIVVGVSLGAIALLSPAPALAPILAMAGLVAPDLAVATAARRRMARADRELPLLLDVLAAASSGGLSAQLAFRRAVSAIEGPLASELGSAIRSVDLGARWREELRAVAERLDLPDLRRTVAALARTESLGSSLAESMSDLAAQVRESRRAAAAERARKAPVKMLFPLVFLVLPAFLLLTVVPVLITTMKSMR